MQQYKGFLLGLMLVAGAVLVGWKWHPGPSGFAVVELFTSQGCSSCPPAEALLARTQGENKDLPVYLLAFHVDYWDRQGWKDVFSNAAYSDRQRQYFRWLRLKEIYTPQAVVNGATEFVGSDAVSMNRAIQTGLQQGQGPALMLNELRLDAGRISWHYSIARNAMVGGQQLILVATVVEKNALTEVKGGENNGKTLREIQIVRSLGVQTTDPGGSGSGHLDWPEGLSRGDGEVIAFLQDRDSGKIIAATRAEP